MLRLKMIAIVAGFLLASCARPDSSEPTSMAPTKDLPKQEDTLNAVTLECLDELDPFAANIAQQLEAIDQDYMESTGESPFIVDLFGVSPACKRSACKLWLQVDKSQQLAFVYINGTLQYTRKVSTGIAGHGTPNFDTHPNGRIYDAYSSLKYPGGDYNGLGNMPYAVFISGGFAVHGTGRANWAKLGTKASHGCVRIHPDNALTFNRLVRQYGIYKTWITVQE